MCYSRTFRAATKRDCPTTKTWQHLSFMQMPKANSVWEVTRTSKGLLLTLGRRPWWMVGSHRLLLLLYYYMTVIVPSYELRRFARLNKVHRGCFGRQRQYIVYLKDIITYIVLLEFICLPFLINLTIAQSVKYQITVKNIHCNFPEDPGNVFKTLVLSRQQSNTQIYLI